MPDVFQLSKDIAGIAKGLASVDARMQLSQASIALADLASENHRLRCENDGLRSELARRKALELRNGVYFVIEGDGGLLGPVCPECYREKGLAYRLERTTRGSLYCLTCDRHYALPLGEEPPDPLVFA